MERSRGRKIKIMNKELKGLILYEIANGEEIIWKKQKIGKKTTKV